MKNGRKSGKELKKLIEQSDHEKVEAYLHMFDRILLGVIASHLVPEELVNYSLELWEKVIKGGINSESVRRTNFLEETITGRSAKYRKEPDGEEYRLHCLKQLDVAYSLIENNIKKDSEDKYENEDEDEDDFGDSVSN